MLLEEIVPEKPKVRFKNLPEEITIRPVMLSDEIWMIQKFGESIPEIFAEGKMAEICQIFYNQIEDKTPFKIREVEIVDENGNSHTTKVGGYVLLSMLIQGVEEKVAMIKALTDAMSSSRPKSSETSEKKTQ